MNRTNIFSQVFTNDSFKLFIKTCKICPFILVLLSLNHGYSFVGAYLIGGGYRLQISSNLQKHSTVRDLTYHSSDVYRLLLRESENRRIRKDVSISCCRLTMSQRKNQDPDQQLVRRAKAAPFISDEQMKSTKLALKELEYLVRTVHSLVQSPIDGGCPWTAEQSALDVLGYLGGEVDEIREELELGEASSHQALLSELGDLLFCTFLLIRVCERDKLSSVNLAAAAAFAAAKVRRRAPFVFSDDGAGGQRGPFPNTLLTSTEASAIWKRVKALEKAGLVPICPYGYDDVTGTCILPYDEDDGGPCTSPAAAPADAAAGSLNGPAAGPPPGPHTFTGGDGAFPLLATFAAGVGVGVLLCGG
jgi:NTP pyrophosphatase (non-canonical NTP hydrolase)